MSYEGQILERRTTSYWHRIALSHPAASDSAEALAHGLDRSGVACKVGIRRADRLLLMVKTDRTSVQSLERQFSLFKTWLSPTTKANESDGWVERQLRAQLHNCGLADADLEYLGSEAEVLSDR